MSVAITRLPSTSLDRCELSFVERQPIDVARACAQHAAYRDALKLAGATVIVLPPLEHLPDAVFVEDTAVVVDELAVLTPLGAASRDPESAAIESTLARYRPLWRLKSPATLDGGDVLRVGRTIYVGRTARTNADATRQLSALLSLRGYLVVAVETTGCLHLKTGCSVAGRTPGGDVVIVVNPAWVDPGAFAAQRDCTLIETDPDEAWAANVLALGPWTLVPSGSPATRARLIHAGLRTAAVDISEFQKAEAGMTCLSILV